MKYLLLLSDWEKLLLVRKNESSPDNIGKAGEGVGISQYTKNGTDLQLRLTLNGS